MTRQKPEKVLAAGIVKKFFRSILLNVHRQNVQTAIAGHTGQQCTLLTCAQLQFIHIYGVTFTRLYIVDSSYNTLLSELRSFYPNVHFY